MTRRIQCGINIDPLNVYGNPAPPSIQELGATWVRFTFKDQSLGPSPTGFAHYDHTIRDLEQAQIDVLLILSYETLPGKPAPGADRPEWEDYIARFADRTRQIALHYGDHVAAYQIWNEPDYATPHLGYNPCLPAPVLAALLKATYGAIKGSSSATVVTGGLCSGDAGYVARVKREDADRVLYADAVAIHPYGLRPTRDWPTPTWGFGVLTDAVRRYHAAADVPIWITEFGVEGGNAQHEFPGRAFAALDAELPREAPCAFWFCWSDGMVSPFGLLRVEGDKKPAYSSFQGFARQPLVTGALPGHAVVDYHSHYVLFPSGAPWSWYKACRRYLLKYRITRGESVNDAAKAHGTLGHTITCINPTPQAIANLREANPDAVLDVVRAANAQELEQTMNGRAERDLRFG
ncbi:MAG: hypothetical protein JXA09_11015 [Anaerolineae bacterium]|nr:hypothetical protein [Anaerolineae bacterium]